MHLEQKRVLLRLHHQEILLIAVNYLYKSPLLTVTLALLLGVCKECHTFAQAIGLRVADKMCCRTTNPGEEGLTPTCCSRLALKSRTYATYDCM